MEDKLCECGHKMWDHMADEIVHEDGDESLIFLECSKCDCQAFRDKED